MAKLTPLQRETLTAISDGKVEQRNHGYSAWRTSGASPTVVGRLMSMGLAKWPTQGMGGFAVLTEAGQTVLKEPV